MGVSANPTNLAPVGIGYTWYSMTTSTANSPRAADPGINDGNLNTDVYLLPGNGTIDNVANAYEAAGIVWSNTQTLASVVYRNGSYDAASNGVFDAEFKLQYLAERHHLERRWAAWTTHTGLSLRLAALGQHQLHLQRQCDQRARRPVRGPHSHRVNAHQFLGRLGQRGAGLESGNQPAGHTRPGYRPCPEHRRGRLARLLVERRFGSDGQPGPRQSVGASDQHSANRRRINEQHPRPGQRTAVLSFAPTVTWFCSVVHPCGVEFVAQNPLPKPAPIMARLGRVCVTLVPQQVGYEWFSFKPTRRSAQSAEPGAFGLVDHRRRHCGRGHCPRRGDAGLRVGLVEQHDFAFGTSSRSSRLLHGGLRYLAQGRVGLVHEASVEKKVIHHIAPHLAEPLPFIFPTYRGNRDWVLWQLKIGVKIYDLLCAGRNLGKSTWLSQPGMLQRVPGLTAAGLNGAVRYYDGFTNDARLTIDTLRSAERSGAVRAELLPLPTPPASSFGNATSRTSWPARA